MSIPPITENVPNADEVPTEDLATKVEPSHDTMTLDIGELKRDMVEMKSRYYSAIKNLQDDVKYMNETTLSVLSERINMVHQAVADKDSSIAQCQTEVHTLCSLIAQREREMHGLGSLIARLELITSQLKEIMHDHMNSIEANSRSFTLLKRHISGVEKKS